MHLITLNVFYLSPLHLNLTISLVLGPLGAKIRKRVLVERARHAHFFCWHVTLARDVRVDEIHEFGQERCGNLQIDAER